MHAIDNNVVPYVVYATDFNTWRDQARRLLQAAVPPSAVTWQDAQEANGDLFATVSPNENSTSGQRLSQQNTSRPLRIAKAQLKLLRSAARYRTRGNEQPRWSLLYQAMWRIAQGDATATHPADGDGRVLHQREHSVRREAHHMHAFLRFHLDDAGCESTSAECEANNEARSDSSERFVAWFEPAHDVLDLGAEHFADRMGDSRFMIATPDGGVSWDGRRLDYRTPCPGDWTHRAQAAERQNSDADHALWRTYFTSTFNPARLNHRVMTQHMPQRFWRHLSEGDLIPTLEAKARHGGQRLAQEASVGQRKGKALPEPKHSYPAEPKPQP